MAPGHYTRLFFLDEPTTLAAGHRPCAYCRRSAYLAFRDAWANMECSPTRATILTGRYGFRTGVGAWVRPRPSISWTI